MTEHDFDALMGQVMASADRFGHREHIHLTWLAVRRYGVAAAIDLVSDGIQRTARYAGRPQKYHATISRAWVVLVGHHTAERHDSFDESSAAARTCSTSACSVDIIDPRCSPPPRRDRAGWSPISCHCPTGSGRLAPSGRKFCSGCIRRPRRDSSP